MKISRPNDQEPTSEELQKLERLKAIIERAVADGKITRQEIESIRNEAFSHGKPTADQLCREMDLYKSLLADKLTTGELEYEYE